LGDEWRIYAENWQLRWQFVGIAGQRCGGGVFAKVNSVGTRYAQLSGISDSSCVRLIVRLVVNASHLLLAHAAGGGGTVIVPKKTIRVVVKLDKQNLKDLQYGMQKAGETNMSSYIRRLIFEHKGYTYAPMPPR